VRAYLRKELEKAVERGTIAKPDAISWETAEGRLRVQVSKSGAIEKFSDERTVSIRYRKKDEPEERRRYRTEMEFELFNHGDARVDLPREVKERLELK
jgi:hypothetical protein